VPEEEVPRHNLRVKDEVAVKNSLYDENLAIFVAHLILLKSLRVWCDRHVVWMGQTRNAWKLMAEKILGRL
jgi:hypothetical protein